MKGTEMTEIFATLGPACREKAILREMFKRGMDGMRLNLSHTTLKESAELLAVFHQAAAEAGRQAELLIDLQGNIFYAAFCVLVR